MVSISHKWCTLSSGAENHQGTHLERSWHEILYLQFIDESSKFTWGTKIPISNCCVQGQQYGRAKRSVRRHFGENPIWLESLSFTKEQQNSHLIKSNQFLDPPSQPQGLVFNREADSLEWTVPSADGGSPIIGYLLWYRAPTAETWLKVRRMGATTACIYTNPMRGFEYHVRAENDAGAGLPSSSVFVPDGESC